MTLVAEGVETREHWNKLHELGCDIAQGYFISKPIPSKDLYQWELDRDQKQFSQAQL
jgi:EAL domain-containing protein (putative c-di-GMP-specific phosphodiesterase class I)